MRSPQAQCSSRALDLPSTLLKDKNRTRRCFMRGAERLLLASSGIGSLSNASSTAGGAIVKECMPVARASLRGFDEASSGFSNGPAGDFAAGTRA